MLDNYITHTCYALLIAIDNINTFCEIDLCDYFGVRGTALEWFKSYLTGRSQRLLIDNVWLTKCNYVRACRNDRF